jgi:hypothetical protein
LRSIIVGFKTQAELSFERKTQNHKTFGRTNSIFKSL